MVLLAAGATGPQQRFFKRGRHVSAKIVTLSSFVHSIQHSLCLCVRACAAGISCLPVHLVFPPGRLHAAEAALVS
jgi:hypothetical protein